MRKETDIKLFGMIKVLTDDSLRVGEVLFENPDGDTLCILSPQGEIHTPDFEQIDRLLAANRFDQ